MATLNERCAMMCSVLGSEKQEPSVQIQKDSSTSGSTGSNFKMATSVDTPAKEARKSDSRQQKQKRENQGEVVREPKPGAGGLRSIAFPSLAARLG